MLQECFMPRSSYLVSTVLSGPRRARKKSFLWYAFKKGFWSHVKNFVQFIPVHCFVHPPPTFLVISYFYYCWVTERTCFWQFQLQLMTLPWNIMINISAHRWRDENVELFVLEFIMGAVETIKCFSKTVFFFQLYCRNLFIDINISSLFNKKKNSNC
jgi:hypothetical protein